MATMITRVYNSIVNECIDALDDYDYDRYNASFAQLTEPAFAAMARRAICKCGLAARVITAETLANHRGYNAID